MDILVLDTIHGGREIAQHLAAMGHAVDAVDVYREQIPPPRAEYDLLVAPVHLDPAHPYRNWPARRVISHHEAVAWVLWDGVPHPFVEVTGAQGKTTTAHALASLMEGPGILHTSKGTYLYPDRTLLWRRSITPASVIPAALEARARGAWLVAEESLGVSGAGDLAILTSEGDYPIAAGKKQAIQAKQRLCAASPQVVAVREFPGPLSVVTIDQVTRVEGECCTFSWQGREGSFQNPLLVFEGYRTPLRLAATAACLLGIPPHRLGSFRAVEGRMVVEREGDRLVVDNANSGTNRTTTLEAACYARNRVPGVPLTLVIGEVTRTVCEGFPAAEVEETVRLIAPEHLVLVGDRVSMLAEQYGCPHARTLEEGRARAAEMTGTVVLAVKCWR
jgi:UDP-N-acetylmuramyl pentapeptide synthase